MTSLLALEALMLVIISCAASFRILPASVVWLPWELMSGVILNPYWNWRVIVCNSEYIVFLGGGVHQAHVKINHWISLRCTLFPIKMPMTFCKNIKPLISIDKKSRGNLHQVLYQWGWFEETPPPQQYLFHLLIPTWNRQQDPKRRLYLSHFLPRLRTSGLP